MALTATCKKCNREVPVGNHCPYCGGKLGKTAAHAAWAVEKTPVRDWMSWNAVMRILLPAMLAVLLLTLLLEGLSGGTQALEQMLVSGFPIVLVILLGTVFLLVLLVLLLQGKELSDYVIDSRGVHETRYLPHPTALRLLLRGKSPALMNQLDPEAETPVLRLDEKNLSWREVARVQLWPEKCMVLFYAPVWWLRIPVACTPFTWDDTLSFVREKIGKKKAVQLPASLRVVSAPARRRSKPKQPVLVPEVEEALDRLREEERAEAWDSAPPEEPFNPDDAIRTEAPPLPPDEDTAGEQLTMDLGG